MCSLGSRISWYGGGPVGVGVGCTESVFVLVAKVEEADWLACCAISVCVKIVGWVHKLQRDGLCSS